MFERAQGVALVDVLADFALKSAEHRAVNEVVFHHHTVKFVHSASARVVTVLDFDDVIHRFVGASDLFDIIQNLFEREDANVFEFRVGLVAIFVYAVFGLEVVAEIVGFELGKSHIANLARAV